MYLWSMVPTSTGTYLPVLDCKTLCIEESRHTYTWLHVHMDAHGWLHPAAPEKQLKSRSV